MRISSICGMTMNSCHQSFKGLYGEKKIGDIEPGFSHNGGEVEVSYQHEYQDYYPFADETPVQIENEKQKYEKFNSNYNGGTGSYTETIRHLIVQSALLITAADFLNVQKGKITKNLLSIDNLAKIAKKNVKFCNKNYTFCNFYFAIYFIYI